MEELNFIQLPEWGTRILRFDFSGHTDFVNELRAILLKDRFFSFIMANLSKNGPKLSLEQLVNSLGHEQFKKQILHKIVSRLKNNNYDATYNESDISIILNFEAELSFLQTHGNSRLLLLGLFLYLQNDGESLLKKFVQIGKTYLIQRTKIHRPDFILITLYCLLLRYPKDQVDRLVLTANYDDLYQSLEDIGQDMLIRNFIKYTYSIHEASFIKEKDV